MAQMAPVKTGDLGNTNKSPANKSRNNAARKWCFTLNNYTTDELEQIIKYFDLAPNSYIIGKEVGEQGTPHLQGYVELENKARLSEIKTLSKRIHWEQTKGSKEDNLKYCSKENNYIVKGFKIKKPLKILDKSKLFDWQKDIINIIEKEPDDRKILWYWCENGKSGKTTFAKYLAHHHGAIPIEGKKNDILYCAAEFESDIYIFDLERTQEDYVSYAAIEKIKNGFYMCAKYESKPIIRNPPHVIIFANFEPDKSALSKDRWVIKRLD